MKVFLKVLSDKLFLVAGSRFFDSLPERFRFRNSEISAILELSDKSKCGR